MPSPDYIAGLAYLNQQIRYVVSPPTSLWGNEQRAEFFRIVAAQYGVADYTARRWFTQAEQRRPFLQPRLPQKELVGRIILAYCLIQTYSPFDGRGPAFVQIEGFQGLPNGYPLREVVEEADLLPGLFHWDYIAHMWNRNDLDDPANRRTFYLVNQYQAAAIPDWLPEDLRPFAAGDADPF